MGFKKAQTAMEYLTTYGWAILIMIVVVAVLFYLGVLSPQTPTYCNFPAGFSCVSYQLSAGTGKLYLVVGQATGRTIVVKGINCTQNTSQDFAINGVITYGADENQVVIASGNKAVLSTPNDASRKWLNISCVDADGKVSGATFGAVYNGRIYIKYYEPETRMTRVVVGTILTKYEVGGIPSTSPPPAHYCGDGSCDMSEGEDCFNCPEDCTCLPPPPSCNNNGVCDTEENCGSCPGDCPCPSGYRCCTERIDGGTKGVCTPIHWSCPV